MTLPLAAARAQLPGTSPPPVQRGLPSLGDAGEMTPLAERKLGDAVIRELFRDPDYLDDPVLGEYVDGIWRRLLAGARARGELPPELDERYAWQVLIGRDHTINAFALPGGYFGLHTALVGVVSSRDELAAVLAHEMSHITQRHIARMLGQQSRQTPLVVAAVVAGLIAASKNPQAGAAMIIGGQAAGIQQQLNYSRDMEREADRIGYGIATQAGFTPSGFGAMFETLQKAQRLSDNGDWPYLRSHPLTTQRIADMRQREGVSNGNPPQDLETLLVAARARVLSRPGIDVLRQWAGEPQTPGFAKQPAPRRAAALYAAALAHSELREPEQAERAAADLAPLVAADARAARQARLLQAELALKAGQPQRVLTLLPGVPTRADDPKGEAGRPELLLRARALIATNAAAQASDSLQPWVADHPRDAGAWQQLAAAWAAQGQTLRSLRAEAEVQVAELDYQGAVNRFRAAQDYSRQHPGGNADLIEASIVDARMRETQAALRQQQEAEKKLR
ncbi:M48 family metalloprotease [Ottowia sp.]|uniref:M48 family metallopeptidase n=1 Tax=Ottowia sp. TaxID=1898956 RepID=UPI002D1F9FDE|nr:M48 family metalloprotease [Ottowia sp.]